MTTTESTTTKPGIARLAGIDLARGLAVFGMFGAHVGPDPSIGGVTGVLMEFVQGRSSVLFATLAGLSLAIMSGRQEPLTGVPWRQAAGRIAIRGVILLLCGTALTMTGTTVVVILAYYGVYFLLTLPFTRLRAPALALIAAGTAIAGPLLSFVVRRFLDSSGWGQAITTHDPVEAIGGEGVVRLLFTGSYPVATWLPFVFAGLALGRLDLAAAVTRVRLAVLGPALVLAGYGGSWLAIRLFGVTDLVGNDAVPGSGKLPGPGGVLELGYQDGDRWVASGAVNTDTPAWLLVSSPHSGTPFEIAGSVGVAITVLVCALVLTDKLPRLRVWRPVTAVGSMSLTAYTGHVVAIAVFGLSGAQGEPPAVLLGFIAGAIVFALVWSRFFRRGPLEYLLHEATKPALRLGRKPA
ncbi:DUF418 domain-containing protein [Amycolatopsis sp. MtRt-6]|uniref:DUF418 domain-containing protein n=1 Tax=Amycolatopsis sp. MtRt-6 TaxID=2792782 RepID=UPI001A90AED4|nr:DUF418 domain-containing protein [Amycolatopsis sp. MtRt-6]